MFSYRNNFIQKKLVLLALLFGFIFFLSSRGFWSPVKNIFENLAFPFQKTFYFSGEKAESILSFLGSISDLKAENEKLLEENNRLLAQNVRLSDQKSENELLRKQLELAPKDEYVLEAAFVIGRDPRGLESWLKIDKGNNFNLKPGMPVIVSDGILVGTIKEVYAKSADITLLSDSASLINVKDVQTQAKGILKGEYGLGLVMDLVEHSDVLKLGDEVVTSGLGEAVPKGLLVGEIQQVNETSDKLFLQSVVAPRVKYSQLDMVFVIKGKK